MSVLTNIKSGPKFSLWNILQMTKKKKKSLFIVPNTVNNCCMSLTKVLTQEWKEMHYNVGPSLPVTLSERLQELYN